jgi:hypothetical protein
VHAARVAGFDHVADFQIGHPAVEQSHRARSLRCHFTHAAWQSQPLRQRPDCL